MQTLLDNIIWNCLAGPHAKFAVGTGDVRRYALGFSPIIGCADPQRPDFATLARLCEPRESFYIDIWSGAAPAGWQIARWVFAHISKPSCESLRGCSAVTSNRYEFLVPDVVSARARILNSVRYEKLYPGTPSKYYLG